MYCNEVTTPLMKTKDTINGMLTLLMKENDRMVIPVKTDVKVNTLRKPNRRKTSRLNAFEENIPSAPMHVSKPDFRGETP